MKFEELVLFFSIAICNFGHKFVSKIRNNNREDQRPILNINALIYGVYEDPLNHEATDELRDNSESFDSSVRRTMWKGHMHDVYLDRVL